MGLSKVNGFIKMVKARRAEKKGKSTINEVVTREYTIHLHKYLWKVGFRKRAPKAIKVIKEFAKKAMKTDDVRIDSKLNNKIWAKGVRNVPFRIRVRLSRRRNQDDDSVNRLYTLCQFTPVSSFKGLLTENVESTDE